MGTRFLLGLLITLFIGPANAQTLTLGVVPQQSATRLAAIWTPILNELSKETGIELKFATAKDIPTFEKRVLEGAYDLAYMNPYHFTFFNEHRGYRALARRADKGIRGLIVVAKESPLETLEELKGQKLAFPSPAAFAASVLPRGELAKLGIEIEPVYVSSHDSVYLNVSKGFFVAGGGIGRTLNATDPGVKDQLRVLWTTQEYTPHAVAAHPRVDERSRERITQALVALSQTPSGREVLKPLNISEFKASQDEDWDDVRSLNINLLDPLVE